MSLRKRIFMVVIISLATVMFFFLVQKLYICPFKIIFNIPCPGCGLTRAFKCIMRLKFLEALKYHLLSWPIFIMVVGSFIGILICTIMDKNFFEIINNKIKLTRTQYILLFTIVLIAWIINIVREI